MAGLMQLSRTSKNQEAHLSEG